MRFHRTAIAAAAGILFLGLYAWAQDRKAGLWQVTSNMTWQQSPVPQGMALPAGVNSPFAASAHSTEICVTKEQMEKYGALPPQAQRDCQVTHVVKKADGSTAEIVCTGPMSGSGTVDATWTDDSHVTSKVHFTGKMQVGPTPKTVEWTVESTAFYRGTVCGDVKPIAFPAEK